MAIFKGKLKPGECVTIAGTRICNRWQKRAAESTEEYTKGIKSPRRPWGKTTCEAADRYKAAIDNAFAKDSLRRGVIKAGLTKWKSRTLLKGPTRFAEGVYGAGDVYAVGYKPYHAHFPSIFMPKRYRRGDPRNINRCKVVCAELLIGKLIGNRFLRFGLKRHSQAPHTNFYSTIRSCRSRNFQCVVKKEGKINVSAPGGVDSRIFCAHMASSCL